MSMPAEVALRLGQRAPEVAAVGNHRDGVDDRALPERRGLRLVPERQRQVDVVGLPARRDLERVGVAVQFALARSSTSTSYSPPGRIRGRPAGV